MVVEPFSVRGTALGRAAVVEASGDLDLATVEALDEAVGVACALATEVVLVDLGGVGHVDSSTLGSLVRGRKQAHSLGKDFYVARPGAVATKVLSMTGLLEPFQAPAELLGRQDVQELLG